MSEIGKLFTELSSTLRKILVFDTFIESVVIFLIAYLVSIVLNLTIFISIGIAVVYFFYMLYSRKDLTSIKTVEKKYPVLNEALRTVNDTMPEDNYLVNELRTQVKKKIKKVSASSFMNIKRDLFMVLLAIMLVFGIVGLTICKGTSPTCNKVLSKTDVNYAIKSVNNAFLDLAGVEQDEGLNLGGDIIHRDYNIETKNAVLKDNAVANLGNKKLSLKIKLSDDQIDIHDVSDDVTRKEFMDMDITDISAATDVNFEEDISKEHKELVKNYFDELAK